MSKNKKPGLTELLKSVSKTGHRKRKTDVPEKKGYRKYQSSFKPDEEYWEEIVDKLQDLPDDVTEDKESEYAVCIVEKTDENNKRVLVEEEFVKSVGSDMKKFNWVIIEFSSWDSLITGYPQALRFVRTKTNIGFGFMIMIQEFEKCIEQAKSFNITILWQNQIQDTVLVIKNLLVSAKK